MITEAPATASHLEKLESRALTKDVGDQLQRHSGRVYHTLVHVITATYSCMGFITDAALLVVLLNVLQKREIKCVNVTSYASGKGTQEREALDFCPFSTEHLCIFRNWNLGLGRSLSLAWER